MEITWRELTGCIIDADRVNLLLERETMKECKLMMDHEENKLEFNKKDKKVKLIESKGGNLIAQLKLVKMEDKDAI